MAVRILFVDQFGWLGGGQRVLLELLKSIDRSRFVPLVALGSTGAFREELLKAGFPVHDLSIGLYPAGKKPFYHWLRFIYHTVRAAGRLFQLVRQENVRVLYANGPRVFACTAIAGMISQRKVIWHLHKNLMPGNERRWVQFFSRVPHSIITCSKAVSQSLVKSSPRLSRKVKMIYNPAPSWTADPLLNPVDPTGTHSHRSSDVVHVAIIGRITPFKGQLAFVDAARLILQQSRRYHFWIIGSPVDDDSVDCSYLQEIQDAIQKAEIHDHVSLVPHQLDMGPYYRFLDIIVIASQGPEAFGMVVLEAMCFGKALVVPSEGGIAELVEDQKTAFVMPRTTSSGIASRVIALGEDDTKRLRLGANAREYAKDRFSSESFGQAISEILETGTVV